MGLRWGPGGVLELIQNIQLGAFISTSRSQSGLAYAPMTTKRWPSDCDQPNSLRAVLICVRSGCVSLLRALGQFRCGRASRNAICRASPGAPPKPERWPGLPWSELRRKGRRSNNVCAKVTEKTNRCALPFSVMLIKKKQADSWLRRNENLLVLLTSI